LTYDKWIQRFDDWCVAILLAGLWAFIVTAIILMFYPSLWLGIVLVTEGILEIAILIRTAHVRVWS